MNDNVVVDEQSVSHGAAKAIERVVPKENDWSEYIRFHYEHILEQIPPTDATCDEMQGSSLPWAMWNFIFDVRHDDRRLLAEWIIERLAHSTLLYRKTQPDQPTAHRCHYYLGLIIWYMAKTHGGFMNLEQTRLTSSFVKWMETIPSPCESHDLGEIRNVIMSALNYFRGNISYWRDDVTYLIACGLL